MRICLVTAFPPSTQRLNEYGLHLAEQLRSKGSNFIVLADDYSPREPELSGFRVERCWRFNDLRTPLRLLSAARKAKADVVWFNLVYSTFGDNPLAAFLGLMTPVLLRIAGFRTHVTLHHLMENVELKHADIRFPRLYLWAGSVITRFILMAHQVSVLTDEYRRVLMERYKAPNINVRRHGILGVEPVPPDFSQRTREFRILAFGKFGRYKRLEPMIDAFQIVRREVPRAKLVIAGQDHPNRPGYMQGLADQHKDDAGIEFLGYVAEADLPKMFGSCNVTVLPYSSSGGPSGVAHLAAQFGLPIIASDIEDVRIIAGEEDLALDYYRPDDVNDMAAKLIALAKDPARERSMAEQNYRAAQAMTMPHIVAQYLSDFAAPISDEQPQAPLTLPKEEPRAAA
jgi:glycosyltransferase involved in cell wall biosynthesis